MSIVCKNCKCVFEEEKKFCSKCGAPLQKDLNDTKTRPLNLIIAFYITFLVFSIISYVLYEEYANNLKIEFIVEAVFIGLVLGFSSFDFKDILKLYGPFKIDYKAILLAFAFPVATGILVYYSVEYINIQLFEDYVANTMDEYLYLDNPFLWAFFFVVILPPIFEELAFRGFLFNQLLKVVNTNVTIIATAFIFALIHFSLISLLWIFPFGIVLGYLRSKYNTLWLGMIVHFIHNLIVLLLDYYYFDNSVIALI